MSQESDDQRAEGDRSTVAGLTGKYLTVALDNGIYGIEILRVQEIIGVAKITRVPKSPDYVKGVINLRGKIIPVVDLRLKLGLPEKEHDDKTCFVVVNAQMGGQDLAIGVVVDTVLEVVDLQVSQLEPPPRFAAQVDTAYILGMAKIGEEVVTLLDIVTTLAGIGDEIGEL